MKAFSVRRFSNKKAYERLKKVQNAVLDIGWFDAKYPNGTLVSKVAQIQEFGSPANNIPPRPFLRVAEMDNKTAWRDIYAKGFKAISRGSMTQEQVMNELGERIVSDIRKAILDVFMPPLKEETLKARRRKGNYSDKPLIDTKLMFDTVSFRVELKGNRK